MTPPKIGEPQQPQSAATILEQPVGVPASLAPLKGIGLANKISIGRILLVPAIVACLLYYAPHRDSLRFLALGLFLLGMASDAVDGFLARRYHQRTELGTILDPIADKCLILGTLISCSAIRGLPLTMKIPAWFNVVVISRDAVLIVGTLLLFALRGQWNVQPSRLGKWTTFLQMLVIPTVLLGLTMKTPLLILAATLTVLSGMSYLRVGIRLLD